MAITFHASENWYENLGASMDEVVTITDTIIATVRSADEYRTQAADCANNPNVLPMRITNKIGSISLRNGKT
jgi:hypothetical protein